MGKKLSEGSKGVKEAAAVSGCKHFSVFFFLFFFLFDSAFRIFHSLGFLRFEARNIGVSRPSSWQASEDQAPRYVGLFFSIFLSLYLICKLCSINLYRDGTNRINTGLGQWLNDWVNVIEIHIAMLFCTNPSNVIIISAPSGIYRSCYLIMSSIIKLVCHCIRQITIFFNTSVLYWFEYDHE